MDDSLDESWIMELAVSDLGVTAEYRQTIIGRTAAAEARRCFNTGQQALQVVR